MKQSDFKVVKYSSSFLCSSDFSIRKLGDIQHMVGFGKDCDPVKSVSRSICDTAVSIIMSEKPEDKKEKEIITFIDGVESARFVCDLGFKPGGWHRRKEARYLDNGIRLKCIERKV